MKYNRAFYCEYIPPEGSCADLREEEKHHIFRVLRAKEGDELLLIDGKGSSATTKIANGKSFQIISTQQHKKPEKVISLFVSPPRHSAMDLIISQSVETSVSRIVPIICEHSVAFPKNTDKWKKKLIEACKQSQNPFCPEITEPIDFEKAFEFARKGQIFFGDPQGILPKNVELKNSEFSWFVGPEGGFSKKEIKILKDSGAIGLCLSPVIMRVETAALAGIAVLLNK